MNNTPTPTYVSIAQMAARHPAFTIGYLRFIRDGRSATPLARAFVKIGRRVFIDEPKFLALIEEHGTRGDA